MEMTIESPCRFRWLCEEVHEEPEMVEYRKNCSPDRCRHYRDYYEGYCLAMEED